MKSGAAGKSGGGGVFIYSFFFGLLRLRVIQPADEAGVKACGVRGAVSKEYRTYIRIRNPRRAISCL